jgi:two-component system cell cycle sensor histidine kinase/response regulator CckA
VARVLVAEDELGLAQGLIEVLQAAGHEVRSTAGGGPARELARELVPDLVISDWALASPPDGQVFIDELRAERPAVRAILMTGYPSERLRAWASADPSLTLLEKPFSLADFRAAVARLLAAS